MTLTRYGQGFSETSQQEGAQAGAIAGSFIPIPGASAVLGAVGSLIGGLFGDHTPVLTVPEITADITPAVVNNLQNQGLSLPAGQENAYVQAALQGQLAPPTVNYTVPAVIAGLAVFLLVT